VDLRESRGRGGFQAERGQDELLLLLDQALKGAPGPILAVEELPVQVGGLLAQILERDEVVLSGAEGLRQDRRIVRTQGRDGRGRRGKSVVPYAR
jgi:hypothetical protein